MTMGIFGFKRKKKNSKKTFIQAQELMIERIQEEIHNLESGILFVKNKYGEHSDAYTIPNSLLFFRLSFFDVIILSKKFLEEENEFEKQILAKHLCISIYELLDDLPVIYGKKFVIAIEGLDDIEELDKGRINIQKNINIFKKEVNQELKLIRNYTAAHKEHDSLKQLDIIKTISFKRIELMIQFLHLLWLQILDFEKTIRKPANYF